MGHPAAARGSGWIAPLDQFQDGASVGMTAQSWVMAERSQESDIFQPQEFPFAGASEMKRRFS